MKRPRKRTLVLGGLGLLFAAGLAVAFRPAPVPVQAATVDRGPFEATVDADGRTRARERYVVSAPLTGMLGRVDLEPGDAIGAGEVLATLSPVEPPLLDSRTRHELEARLAAAEAARAAAASSARRVEASLTFSRQEEARLRSLAEGGAATPADLERAEASTHSLEHELEAAKYAIKVADHDLEQAQAALAQAKAGGGAGDRWEIRSPLAGKVLQVFQEGPGVIAAGTPIVEVADPADLEVVVDVLTADAVKIRPGAKVSIERWGGEGALDGRVRRVSPSGFTKVSALGVEEQRASVYVDFESPHDRWATLGDGFRVEAKIVVERVDDAVTAPAAALFRTGDGWAAFALAHGRVERRRVEVGSTNGSRTIVLAGLAPGDRVVVHPDETLETGVRITE